MTFPFVTLPVIERVQQLIYGSLKITVCSSFFKDILELFYILFEEETWGRLNDFHSKILAKKLGKWNPKKAMIGSRSFSTAFGQSKIWANWFKLRHLSPNSFLTARLSEVIHCQSYLISIKSNVLIIITIIASATNVVKHTKNYLVKSVIYFNLL